MTFFGWLLVIILSAMLGIGIGDLRRGRRLDGAPIPDKFKIALVVIALLIIGILTIGTGSLL